MSEEPCRWSLYEHLLARVRHVASRTELVVHGSCLNEFLFCEEYGPRRVRKGTVGLFLETIRSWLIKFD